MWANCGSSLTEQDTGKKDINGNTIYRISFYQKDVRHLTETYSDGRSELSLMYLIPGFRELVSNNLMYNPNYIETSGRELFVQVGSPYIDKTSSWAITFHSSIDRKGLISLFSEQGNTADSMAIDGWVEYVK